MIAMAKSALDVTIDNRETFAMIEGLIRKIERPEPLLKIIGSYIQAQTSKMFRGIRPDTSGVRGEKWEPLKKSTVFKKRALAKRGLIAGNPNRPLVETGALRDDLMAPRAIKIERKGLVYGTDRTNSKGFSYPAVHQTGSLKKHIPKRRWLFLNNDELNQIANTVKQWLDGNKGSV